MGKKKAKARPKRAEGVTSEGSKAKKGSRKAPRKAKSRTARAIEYGTAKRAIGRYGEEIMKLPGVTGLSVGPRFQQGEPTNEVTIRLHVATEEAKRYLKENADELGFRKMYGGVGTDIVVWNFGSACAVGELPDGTRIKGDGGPGTLGTTAVARLNSQLAIVWITAAHVAAPTAPAAGVPVNIFIPGNASPIGTVAREHYFNEATVDAAYIIPNSTVPVPPRRTIRHLTAIDVGKSVTLDGSVTRGSTGVIVSLFFDGHLTDGTHVTDHFLVHHPAQNAPRGGDSGAILKLGRQYVGVLRAVDEVQQVSVFCKLDVVREHTRRLDVGFKL